MIDPDVLRTEADNLAYMQDNADPFYTLRRGRLKRAKNRLQRAADRIEGLEERVEQLKKERNQAIKGEL